LYCGEKALDSDYTKLVNLFKEKGYRCVVLLNTSFPPYPTGLKILRGGIESDVESTVEALGSNGFKVTIAALHYIEKLDESTDSRVERIGIYRPYALEKSSFRKGLRLLTSETFKPGVFFRLLSLLRKENCDVIILFGSLQLSLAPYLASRILRIPIYVRNDWICPARPYYEACGFSERVLGCGDCLEVNMGMELGGFAKLVIGVFSGLVGVVKSWLWRRAAGALPISEYHSNLFKGYGVPTDRLTVVHPSRRIRKSPIVDEPFTELLGSRQLKILYVGRLEKDKGIDLLLDAFKKAVRERDDMKLLVAGEGLLRDLVQECASRCPQVTYLGWLDVAGLSQAYQVSDVVIIPTIVPEGHGVVAEEAISYEKLIVGPLSGGLKELLETYPDSISLDEVSVDSLYRTILSLARGHVGKSDTPTG